MTLFQGFGFWSSSLSGAAPGMILVKPTSITHSGTSATLGANGQVTFTAVTSLSLNGVFTADFDNYFVSFRHVHSTGGTKIVARLRSSGTDASASNYVYQELQAYSTTVNAFRYTSQTNLGVGLTTSTQRSGDSVYIYGPYLAQPTAFRNVNIAAESGAWIRDHAGTHSLSTSYDGITIYPESGNITGALQVYGVRS